MEDFEEVAKLLGSRQALGRSPRTLLDVIDRVRAGLNPKVLDALAESLDLSQEEVGRLVGLSRRSLNRRKTWSKLPPAVSEGVVRVARVAGRAVEVLGSTDAAHRWLQSPNRALGGRTPLSLLDTAPGAELVGDVLERIEHGVYG